MLRLQVPINRTEDGNTPIEEFAAEHIGDAETITFEVVYPRGDQDRDEEWSSPDVLTVDRAGVIVDAYTAE